MIHRSLILFSILCGIVVLGGCSEDSAVDTAAAQKKLSAGWTAYHQGNFSEALLNFERAINLDSTLADADNGLGWSHLSASRAASMNQQTFAQAQNAFEEAIRLDASNADAWIGLANALFLRREKDSDFQAALRAIDNALKGDHQTLFRHDYRSAADLYALRAACYYYLDETDLARSSIDAALAIESQNAAALSLRQALQ